MENSLDGYMYVLMTRVGHGTSTNLVRCEFRSMEHKGPQKITCEYTIVARQQKRRLLVIRLRNVKLSTELRSVLLSHPCQFHIKTCPGREVLRHASLLCLPISECLA